MLYRCIIQQVCLYLLQYSGFFVVKHMKSNMQGNSYLCLLVRDQQNLFWLISCYITIYIYRNVALIFLMCSPELLTNIHMHNLLHPEVAGVTVFLMSSQINNKLWNCSRFGARTHQPNYTDYSCYSSPSLHTQ